MRQIQQFHPKGYSLLGDGFMFPEEIFLPDSSGGQHYTSDDKRLALTSFINGKMKK